MCDRPLRRYEQGPRRKREIETTHEGTPCGRGSSCCHHLWVCTRHPGGARCVEFRDVVYPGLFLFKCESAARHLNTTGCIVCNSQRHVELLTTNTEVEQSVSRVVLLATPLVSGVAVNLTPKNFTFLGDIEAVTLEIHVAENQSVRDLPIEVQASTRAGAQSENFRFQLNKALILIDFSGGGVPKR